MYEPVLVLDSFIHWLALYVSTSELYFPYSWIVNLREKLMGVLGVSQTSGEMIYGYVLILLWSNEKMLNGIIY